jgi:TonB family protein
MRAPIFAGLLALSSGCLTSAENNGDDEGSSGVAAQNWCVPPLPFEAQYDDGAVLVRGRALEDSPDVSEWTYFNRFGEKIYTEKRRDGHPIHATGYYPGGKPLFYGELMFDAESEVVRAQGIWELLYEDGAVRARALMLEGEAHGSSMQEMTPDGEEIPWSLPENIFVYREARPVSPVEPRYPLKAQREQIHGRTCTLVCVDEEGTQVGIFRLAQAGNGFDEAAELAIRAWRFYPRRIGELPVPACVTQSVDFERLWTMPSARRGIPRPIQRRPGRQRP